MRTTIHHSGQMKYTKQGLLWAVDHHGDWQGGIRQNNGLLLSLGEIILKLPVTDSTALQIC